MNCVRTRSKVLKFLDEISRINIGINLSPLQFRFQKNLDTVTMQLVIFKDLESFPNVRYDLRISYVTRRIVFSDYCAGQKVSVELCNAAIKNHTAEQSTLQIRENLALRENGSLYYLKLASHSGASTLCGIVVVYMEKGKQN